MLTPILLGLMHAIVDATTVSAVMRASHLDYVARDLAFFLVLGYDLVAFGSQVFFGWLSDKYASPRTATITGLLLSLSAVVVMPLGVWAVVACAGIGNALFHLGAGAQVLRAGLERSTPSGIFVGPGALGLAFGLYYGTNPSHGPLWPLLLLSSLALVTVVLFPRIFQKVQSVSSTTAKPLDVNPWLYGVLALLLISIVVRSLVGLSAARGYPRSELLLIGIPTAAFLGKSFGGFLADKLGWLETGTGALLLSMPLIALSPKVPVLLVGLFLFQMTMPVTLTAVARLLPQRLATAFGWTCLALILGAMPTMFPEMRQLCSRPMLGTWILISAATLFVGLFFLPNRPRRFNWLPEPTRATAKS